MKKAATTLDFEEAARLRDRMKALQIKELICCKNETENIGSEGLSPFLSNFWIVVAGRLYFLATKLTFLRLSNSLRISTFSSAVNLLKISPLF